MDSLGLGSQGSLRGLKNSIFHFYSLHVCTDVCIIKKKMCIIQTFSEEA